MCSNEERDVLEKLKFETLHLSLAQHTKRISTTNDHYYQQILEEFSFDDKKLSKIFWLHLHGSTENKFVNSDNNKQQFAENPELQMTLQLFPLKIKVKRLTEAMEKNNFDRILI